MRELPDITIYIESLQSRIVGQPLQRIRIASPFLLRSVDPPITDAENKRVLDLRRIGKQIVWELEDQRIRAEDDLFLVFHLMIAGRFHRLTTLDESSHRQLVEKQRGAKVSGKVAAVASY
jgi:formamidopyrimidine-DNA glycosylase